MISFNSGFMAARYIELGVAYFRENDFSKAVAYFDAALEIRPDDPYAHWNRASALLSMGDYERGFKEHCWVWRLFHWRGFGPVGDDIDRLTTLPIWSGDSGVRVLLYHEMGFGDAIMAMRYLPELKRRAGDITLVIDPSLERLASRFSLKIVTKVPGDLTGFDARLSLFDAMRLLDQTLETIPSEPYIRVPLQRCEGKIGIAWSGRTQVMFSAHEFISRLNHEGFELYALQPGPVDGGEVMAMPPGSDFADVADRIAQMTHVVCVDTAAIHLAGAMGHPSIHLMLPFLMDWRWWHAQAWYPTIKTYRQPQASDWTLPFAQVNEALQPKE
jgi:hypothetical protein